MSNFNEIFKQYAIVYYSELTGLLIARAVELERLDEPKLNEKLGFLRTLVGPANLDKFLALARELGETLTMGEASRHRRYSFKEAIKFLEKTLDSKRFSEVFGNDMLTEKQQYQLSDVSLWSVIQRFEGDEHFIAVLLSQLEEKTYAYVLKQLDGYGLTEKKLKKKVETLDLTMGELRLLMLVLELIADYTIKKHSEPLELPFKLPEPRWELIND